MDRSFTLTLDSRARQDRTALALSLRAIVNTRHWDFSCPAAGLVDTILDKVGRLLRVSLRTVRFFAGCREPLVRACSPGPRLLRILHRIAMDRPGHRSASALRSSLLVDDSRRTRCGATRRLSPAGRAALSRLMDIGRHSVGVAGILSESTAFCRSRRHACSARCGLESATSGRASSESARR